MVAGSFHAPIFGALMIFEMTSSYEMLVPLVISAAIGYALALRFRAARRIRSPCMGKGSPSARGLPTDGSIGQATR